MKTSIVIPCRYRPDLTQTCIDSILNYTKDFELILVQEGEDEKITTLLKEYEHDWQFKIKFVQNKIPKGFAGAMNTGLKLADKDTDYYCFLNNDTVVTPNWLDEMLKAFDNPEVGCVSPTFSGTSSRQSVEWNDGREIEYVYNPLGLIGVCFLIKKAVLDKVGQWDESFGLGGEEDYDLTIRISNAGYLLAIARKSYIYHYWGASFKEYFKDDINESTKFTRGQFKKLERKHKIKIVPDN